MHVVGNAVPLSTRSTPPEPPLLTAWVVVAAATVTTPLSLLLLLLLLIATVAISETAVEEAAVGVVVARVGELVKPCSSSGCADDTSSTRARPAFVGEAGSPMRARCHVVCGHDAVVVVSGGAGTNRN